MLLVIIAIQVPLKAYIPLNIEMLSAVTMTISGIQMKRTSLRIVPDDKKKRITTAEYVYDLAFLINTLAALVNRWNLDTDYKVLKTYHIAWLFMNVATNLGRYRSFDFAAFKDQFDMFENYLELAYSDWKKKVDDGLLQPEQQELDNWEQLLLSKNQQHEQLTDHYAKKMYADLVGLGLPLTEGLCACLLAYLGAQENMCGAENIIASCKSLVKTLDLCATAYKYDAKQKLMFVIALVHVFGTAADIILAPKDPAGAAPSGTTPATAIFPDSE